MIKEYTVINTETNAVLRYVTCLQADSSANCFEGESIVEGRLARTEASTSVVSSMRSLRDSILVSTDWTQLPDSPLTDSKKAEWVTYRSTLRDIPETYTDVTTLDEVVWPTPPTGAL